MLMLWHVTSKLGQGPGTPFWERGLHEQHLETPVPCKVPPATAVPRGPLTLGPGSNAQGDRYLIAGPLTGGGVGSTLGHTGIRSGPLPPLPAPANPVVSTKRPPTRLPWSNRARPMLSGRSMSGPRMVTSWDSPRMPGESVAPY